MRSIDPTLVPTSTPGESARGFGDGASAGFVEGGRRAARRRAEELAASVETVPLSVIEAPVAQSTAVLSPAPVVASSPGSRPALSIDATVSPRRAARAAREAAAAIAMTSADAPAPVSPMLAATAPLVLPTPVVLAEAAVAAEPVAPAARVAPAPLVGLAASVPVHHSAGGRRQTFVPVAHRPSAQRSPRVVVQQRPPVAPAASSPRRGSAVKSAARVVTMFTLVCGILATTILPVLDAQQNKAYAANTAAITGTDTTTSSKGQSYNVAGDVTNSISSRDSYGATSILDYEGQVIANRLAQKNTTYTGPTAADYIAHPLYSHTPLDRAAVFQTALQYLGTPYVHGGAEPSAFDCSGFIMFVYAQYGISLPHYVPSQNTAGTTIPESEAVPGDLVVFDSGDHDGFYAGNGMIMDAPKPGGHISVRPIWSDPHHFVRIGA